MGGRRGPTVAADDRPGLTSGGPGDRSVPDRPDSRYRLLTRPTDTPRLAAVAGLVGGLLILLDGLVEWAVASFVPAWGFVPLGTWNAGFAVFEAVVGMAILYPSWRITQTPPRNVLWGTLILLLGLASILAGGGFAIGALLTVTSGVLAISWRPSPPFYLAPADVRMCLDCGVSFEEAAPMCPKCGTPYEPPGALVDLALGREFR
jgi:hypothetical protein